MALIYTMLTSLDGYLADRDGSFDWAAPGEEVHAFVNDLERATPTHLYGRRMYETMAAWETMPTGPDQPAAVREFAAIWRAAEHVVYSATLPRVWTARTRLERTFDPAAVRALVDAAPGDVSVSGAGLAGAAFRAGLVEEVRLFLHPVAVGGGTPALPTDVRLNLDLLDEHRFPDGVVHLRYRVT